MTRFAKTLTILFTVIGLIMGGGFYLLYSFLNALGPDEITITANHIETNGNFINGITIEKIKVDSIGKENYPIKYTVTYLTSCQIDHPIGKPPSPPDEIFFKKEGKYWWIEESVNISYIHEGLSRKTSDTVNQFWGMNSKKFKTCPLKFEREQWYFIISSDRSITGLFFYIDKNGKEHQFTLPSGVCPI